LEKKLQIFSWKKVSISNKNNFGVFFGKKKKFLIFFREKLSDPFPNARKKFISLYGFEGMLIKIVLFFKCLINQKIYRISLFLATIFFILFYKTR
jgi:hypothetical protein